MKWARDRFSGEEEISKRTGLTRLVFTVLGGFALLGLWLFVMEPPIHNNVITVTNALACTGADLGVTKTVSNATPNVGDVITYTITVTNSGPEHATGVQLTDKLPTGVTFSGYTATQGIYTSATGLWDVVGGIDSGAGATLTITATVDGGTCITTITNTADGLTADQSDPIPANNEASVTITVTGADLAVAKAVNNNTPKAGEVITYTIMVTNNGPDNATGVRLTDVLPAGVTFGGYAATQGIYTSTTGLWTVDEISCGARATLTITATVNSCTGAGTITNTAHSLTGDQPDPNPDNNEASAGIAPNSAYCLYLPFICENYEPIICNPYFDDFSDSNSGWAIENDSEVRLGYSAGEYFIHGQVTGLYMVTAPVSFSNRYTVEVDARWDNANMGYEYGLMFGIVDFASPTYRSYRFGIDPANQRYRLRYHNGSSWGCIDEPSPCTWVNYTSIITDSKPDSIYHLTVRCNGAKVSLYINSNLLWESGDNITSCRGEVGLFAQSDPNALAYFDNFQVSCPFGINSPNIIESNMSPVSTMSRELELDE